MTFALLMGGMVHGGETSAGCLSRWWNGDDATGDWLGVRTTLVDKGVDIGLTYDAEVWGNTTGGIRTGAVYTGLGQITTAVDLEKLMGWKGGSFYSRWLWTSGQDASGELVGNQFTISNIAAYPTFRNIELWLQQDFWEKKISLRAGQLAADSEFVISSYGSLFLNGTFGWPAFVYANIPNGGPGYPMGAPGVRLSVAPTSALTFLAGVYQGDVFPQNVNRHGFRWRLNGDQGFLFLAEAQYQHSAWLPGTMKAGAWFDTGDFASASNPEKTDRGDGGFYFIADQMVYQEPTPVSGKDGKTAAASGSNPQGLGAFARIAFDPQDRNFFGFYVDAGLNYQGLIPTRDNDSAGLALAYGQLTGGTADLLEEAGLRNAGYEMVLEATYAAQITPWMALQPDVQYIIHPGATTDEENAFVIGARVTITF